MEIQFLIQWDMHVIWRLFQVNFNDLSNRKSFKLGS